MTKCSHYGDKINDLHFIANWSKENVSKHIDLKTVFLNGDLDEEVYLKHNSQERNMRHADNQSLYGLQQPAPSMK